jgi:HD superfamily phosphodiesterase
MELDNRYNTLKGLVVDRKTEFAALMAFVERETSYLITPASTKFHLCHERGLLEHSVNVAETMLKLRETLAPEISAESCVIVALLHDLGKAGMPGEPQYLKNEASEKQKNILLSGVFTISLQQRADISERANSKHIFGTTISTSD